MTILATTLILSSGLAGCFGGKDEGNKVDLSALRQQCSELSGYSGNAQYVKEMGIVFVWRADDKEVADLTHIRICLLRITKCCRRCFSKNQFLGTQGVVVILIFGEVYQVLVFGA